ncbi:Os12g0426300 [Oryza sativa Japonica Group]|uniref:Os12g0426300 protein n=1 Tax=Oryza sativa subsp. japonica TaxID=39947 RepID=Q2QSK2_ORYSJ|nr:hypothetical protein LOC_Os12g23820 [Oryza sativa Japonica Group]BAT16917.1 Os12g0426300 [Oryza sativa Japonica Group]
MAIGADELPFHDWQVVDPASMAYIRHLVESLEHLTFDDACMLQLDGGENASDLFNLHRPVITGVPHDVASALNTLEEILSRGSPTLEAYQREDIRETRVLQEEKVRTTMAEVHYIDGLVDEHMDAVEGTRARLHAARDTKQQLLEKITAAAADGDVASLELELSEAEESEAALLAEFMNQWQSVLAVHKHRGVAKNRFEDEVVALMAIPQLPGHSEDQHLVGDAEERYEDSVLLLDEFLDMQY